MAKEKYLLKMLPAAHPAKQGYAAGCIFYTLFSGGGQNGPCGKA
jgi:hypothetical protein